MLALEPALLFRLPLLIIETFNSWLKLSAAGKSPLRGCQFVKSKSARQQLSPVVNAVAEVEFVSAVSAGSSVKFLPAV